MNILKSCGTAMALVFASSLPSFAQDTTILLGVEGSDAIYRVDMTLAAELCGISEQRLMQIAAQSPTIYCTAIAANTTNIDFENDDRFALFNDDNEDDDDDNSETTADTDNMDGGDDGMADDGMTDDGMTDGSDDGMTDDGMMDDGMTDDGGADAGADADVGADTDADVDGEAGADVEGDADAETSAGSGG